MTGQFIPQRRMTEVSSSQAIRGETVPLAGAAPDDGAGDDDEGWCAAGRVEPESDNQGLP
jgi:hypothetical protein